MKPGENNSQTTDAENGLQGGNTSNESENSENNDNQSQYVTVDQLNRALTGYNKRSEKSVEKSINDALVKALSPFQSLLNPSTEDSNISNESQEKQNNQPNKEMLKLQKMLEDVTKKLEHSEQEKENASKQALEERVKSQVLSTLTNLKVEKGEQVYRLIRDMVVIDESGNAKIRVTDPTLGFEEEKDLKSGISDWLNSEGSHFLPPRNLSGSGASNQNQGTGNNQKIVNPNDLLNMSPKELAQVDLKKVLGEDALKTFFNTN